MKTPQPRWEECARGEHEWGAVAEGVRCRWCRVLLTGADADAIWQGAREGAAASMEQCICAAIRLANGEVWRGHRHNDAILTAGKAGVSRDAIAEAEQGFITSRNRFVGREEGCELQRAAGIPSAQTKAALKPGMLFSEDLYLRDWREAVPPAPVEGAAALRTLIADLVKALKWADGKLSKFVTEDTGNGAFVRGTSTELAGFGLPRAEMRDVTAKAESPLSGEAKKEEQK